MKFHPKLKIGLLMLLLITFFVVLNLTAISKEVKNFFYLISAPIQKTLWQAGDRVSDFFSAISKIKNLKKENEELLLRNQALMSEIAGLKEFKEENKTLKEALEVGLEKEFRLAFAEVIGKDISQDSILINKGSEQGILENMAAITSQKVLLGKVNEVNKNFSKVMLTSNKESSLIVQIQEKEVSGLVKGTGHFRLFLDHIPQESEIEVDDFLITTSLGGIFPKGLLVGKIKEVKKSDVEPFQQAEVAPAFDISRLEGLFIITNY